jgi:hypothetical protein
VNPGALLETRRSITFILYNVGEDTLVPVGFDFDNDGVFDYPTWNLAGGLTKSDIVDTGPSGHEAALNLKGKVGSIQLNWQDDENLDLGRAWSNNGGLLNYEVQMKVSPFVTGSGFSQHYMLGLSFRHRQKLIDPTITTSYGISFFRSDPDDKKPPDWVETLPSTFQDLRDSNVYLVLWHVDDGNFDRINYKTLASPMVTNNEGVSDLSDYSTMLLKLDEQVNGGIRENHISVFLQNTHIYPNWDSLDDIRWSDDEATFLDPVNPVNPVIWHNGTQDNVDSRLTSLSFGDDRPSEIAVHVYYDQSGNNKKFFDDFGMKMDGFRSSGSGVDQIQY